MTVTAGLENKKRGRAIREILRQLRKMRSGKVTENELMMAKKTLLGQLMGYYDSPMLIELWYLPRLLRGNTETIGELRDKLETVTVKDLARVAKRLTLDTVYFLRAGQDGGEEEDCDE
jgi:predicted Zn-dependent peptidase